MVNEQIEMASMTATPRTVPQHELVPAATPYTDMRSNDEPPSGNPYDNQPEAPPRFKTNENCVFHSRILSSKKPLSDRLFLDINDENDDEKNIDGFVPIALAPSKSSLRRFQKIKVTPIAKSNMSKMKKNLVPISTIPKPLPPRLSVSWVNKRRSNQQHLFLDYKTR